MTDLIQTSTNQNLYSSKVKHVKLIIV